MVLSLLRLFCLLPLLFLSRAHLQAPASVEPAEEGVTFQVKNAGITVDGSFSDLQAVIQFDPGHWADARLEASVAANTIKTGIKLRDEHLQGRGYFAAEKYPRIRMVLKQIAQKGSRYLGTFDLTIRDVNRPVTFPFAYTSTASGGQLQGSFQINRRDFGVGGNSLTLADEVTVRLEVPVPAASK